MNKSHYARLGNDDLTLRDELALDRTLLANERTLLAYLRSGVTLVIAGITIMHFTTWGWFWAVGFACLPIGALAALTGTIRYRRMNERIARVRRRPKPGAGDLR